jgi:hypothetical protein
MAESRKAWYELVEALHPYIVKVTTPHGSGTGVFLANSPNGELYGIATAAHVVAQANQWGFPIRIEHHASKKAVLLHAKDRHIDASGDAAVIILRKGGMQFPGDELPLMPEGRFLKVGNEVGWLGFPAIINPDRLCFFSGYVSCRMEEHKSYLVDGVSINGVSGGPVLCRLSEKDATLIGVVSAYIPNVTTGTSMPGLCVVQDVSPFYATIKKLKQLPANPEQPVQPKNQQQPQSG